MNDSPFSIYYHPILKKTCLEWMGSYELCDICGKRWRMSNVTYVDTRFVCYECLQKPLPPIKKGRHVDDNNDELVHVCDDCHDWVGLSDMIVDGNRILCPTCAKTEPYTPFGWG